MYMYMYMYMYVCIYVCMYIYTTHTHRHTQTQRHTHTCVCICIYVYMYIYYMCVCVCVCVCVCLCVCVCIAFHGITRTQAKRRESCRLLRHRTPQICAQFCARIGVFSDACAPDIVACTPAAWGPRPRDQRPDLEGDLPRERGKTKT
jgi:hypothetical protein